MRKNYFNSEISVQGFIDEFKSLKQYCLNRISDLDINSKHYYKNKAKFEGSIIAYDTILMAFENLKANNIDFDLSKFNEKKSFDDVYKEFNNIKETNKNGK